MVVTENEILSTLLTDGSGNPNTELAPIFDNLFLIGEQVRQKDGAIVLHNNQKELFNGITDAKGDFMYIRYNGSKKINDKNIIVPLRACIVLTTRGDIDKVSANIAFYLNKNTNIKVSEIERNTYRVFVEETGLPIEDLKRKIWLAYIDFNCYTFLPNCLNFDI